MHAKETSQGVVSARQSDFHFQQGCCVCQRRAGSSGLDKTILKRKAFPNNPVSKASVLIIAQRSEVSSVSRLRVTVNCLKTAPRLMILLHAFPWKMARQSLAGVGQSSSNWRQILFLSNVAVSEETSKAFGSQPSSHSCVCLSQFIQHSLSLFCLPLRCVSGDHIHNGLKVHGGAVGCEQHREVM